MRLTFYIIAFFLFFNNCSAQSQIITKDEYDKAFQFAVRETNADFPFIFKVITESIQNGKTIHTVTEINVRESPGHERIKKTIVANGDETISYQIKVGFGNVFCSGDELVWRFSKYECSNPTIVLRRGVAESVEYSVLEKSINGNKVKIYRQYSVFAQSKHNRLREFQEKTSIIDSRGFFINVVETGGTLEPKNITFKREQSWETKAKIKPIVAPKIN